MSKNVTEFEDRIDEARAKYSACLHETISFLEHNNDPRAARGWLATLHSQATEYFNLFERSIAEYGLTFFEKSDELRRKKLLDSIDIARGIIKYFMVVRGFAERFNLTPPTVSDNDYSILQEFIRCFDPNVSKQLKVDFMNAKLPTSGFEGKLRFRGWQIGGTKLTALQIVFGVIASIIAGWIVFNKSSLTGTQYLFTRALFALGLTLIGTALLEGNMKLKWTLANSLVLKVGGWAALFVLLYYFNPPSAPQP